jgi:steroid delta-isomerase-like uncharacterized protein
MGQISPAEIAMNWIAAYNSHQVEDVTALYAERASNCQLPWDRLVEGSEALKAVYTNLFRAFPDIHINAIKVISDGSDVVVEWVFSGTMTGHFAGHEPNGRRFEMNGCEILEMKDGKIFKQRGYWDKTTLLSQLGLG